MSSSCDRHREPAATFSVEVIGVAGAGDGQHVGALVQRPGQSDLGGGRVVGAGDGEHSRLWSVGAPAVATWLPAIEKNGTNAMRCSPQLSSSASARVMADAVPVLDADHRRDGLGLGEVVGLDVGEAQVADESGLAQVGQCAEVLGDGVRADDAQVHHVEVVAAELAQVLLDLAAQLAGAWPGSHSPEGSRAGPTFVVMTRSSGYGARAQLISSLAERSGEK